MATEGKSALSGYIQNQLFYGNLHFTSQEAEDSIGVGHGAFLDAAERLQLRNVLISPRQGFYLIVAPNYQHRGSPPATLYVDALMRHVGADYYVGLLTAAGHHGASHQAVQVFQVVCGKQQKKFSAGRSRFEFFYRKDMGTVSRAVESRTFHRHGGQVRMSGPELTALDLIRYRNGSGSVSFVSTVLAELAPKACPERLAEMSAEFEKSEVQRLGYHLEFLQYKDHARELRSALEERGQLQWVNLRKRLAHDRYHSREPLLERSERWFVEVDEHPDPDV